MRRQLPGGVAWLTGGFIGGGTAVWPGPPVLGSMRTVVGWAEIDDGRSGATSRGWERPSGLPVWMIAHLTLMRIPYGSRSLLRHCTGDKVRFQGVVYGGHKKKAYTTWPGPRAQGRRRAGFDVGLKQAHDVAASTDAPQSHAVQLSGSEEKTRRAIKHA